MDVLVELEIATAAAAPGDEVNVAVAFDCTPMAAREGWFSAGPWEIGQCAGPGPGLCREDFLQHDRNGGVFSENLPLEEARAASSKLAN